MAQPRASTRTKPRAAPKRGVVKPKAAPARKKAPKLAVPAADPHESLYVRLGFLMHDVSRLRRNAFDKLMRPMGVTRSQWWVLAYLSRHNGMTQTELANILDIGKVTLGGLIDRLEASGWVSRRADSVDRRVRRIFLASATEDLFKQMRALETRFSNEILKGMTERQAEELFNSLTLVKHNLLALGASVGQNGDNDWLTEEE